MCSGYQFFRVGTNAIFKARFIRILGVFEEPALCANGTFTIFTRAFPYGCCMSFHGVYLVLKCPKLKVSSNFILYTKMTATNYTYYQSPVGILKIGGTDHYICELSFVEDKSAITYP